MVPRDCVEVFNETFSVVWVVEPSLTLVCMLWLGGRFAPGASSSRQSGSHCWGKRIIRIVPLTRIQQQGAAFEIVPLDLFRSTLCRCCYICLMYMIWCIYVCCALLICYHELFRYLDYYLIMISVWEAWPRLLILLILLYCWYIVIGYGWLIGTVPPNLFRSTLCRIRISLRESSIYVGFRSVTFDSVSLLLYLIDVYDLMYTCMLCIVDMLSWTF